jgi:hypothetical protein
MAVQGNLLAGSDLTRMVAAVQGNRPKTIGEFADEQRILQQQRASDMMKFGADFALSKAKLDSSIQENQAMMEFRRASLAQDKEFDDLPLRSRLMFVDKQKFPSTFEKTEERINELNKLLDRVNQDEYANQRDKKQVENRIEKLTQSLSTVFNPSSKFGKSARGLYESGNVPSYILDSFAPNVDITVLNRIITENAGKSLGLNDPTKLKSGLD